MFNFQPFSSNQPGGTRAYLLDEDECLAGVVSFVMSEDFVRISAEILSSDKFRTVRHSVAMQWADRPSLVDDTAPEYHERPPQPVPAWAFWRSPSAA